jgi:hypothetical protein
MVRKKRPSEVARVVHGDHVRMIETRGQSRLAKRTVTGIVLGDLRREDQRPVRLARSLPPLV